MESIAHNAAAIGIPKKPSKNGDRAQKQPGNKKGTVQKKGTPITRDHKRQRYDIPDFNEVSDVNNDKPYWFDDGVITLNVATPYINDFILNADPSSKMLARHTLVAEYFVRRNYLSDTSEDNHVQAYLRQYQDQLVRIHKQVR